MQRKAFLVYFPKKEINHNWQQFSSQSFAGTPPPDNRPTLIVAFDISEVAERNKSAIKIEEIDVRSVFVFSHEPEGKCPLIKKEE